jgi:hypothetical protein
MNLISQMLAGMASPWSYPQSGSAPVADQPSSWNYSLPYGGANLSFPTYAPAVQVNPLAWQNTQSVLGLLLGNAGALANKYSYSNPFVWGAGGFSPQSQLGGVQPSWGGGFGQMAAPAPFWSGNDSKAAAPAWGGGFEQMASSAPRWSASSPQYAQPFAEHAVQSLGYGRMYMPETSGYTAFQDITHAPQGANDAKSPSRWNNAFFTDGSGPVFRNTGYAERTGYSSEVDDSSSRDMETRYLNFNNVNYIFGKQNVKVQNGGKSAEILYPEGSASPSMGKIGGASFQTSLGLRPSDEMHLKYNVTFGEDFDFRNGGKLPGLAGGAANSGGHQPNGKDGWSARIDFRKDGAAEIYAYLPTQKDPAIQALKKGDKGFSLGRVEGVFEPGGTYQIEERVKMNTPGKANGRLQLYVNGEKIVDQKGLVISNSPKLKADQLMFSTFFGGSEGRACQNF